MELLRMVVLSAALVPAAASAQGLPAPKDALLYIISPADGDTIRGAFWCRFGLRNMGVSHAGDDFSNAGHHHLLIDADEPIEANEPIPHDRKHLHFGGGETEALLELPPGRHTLQLVLGDGKHYPFDPPIVSKKITITVKGEDNGESTSRIRSKRPRSAHGMHRIHAVRGKTDPRPVAHAPKASGQDDCPPSGLMRLLRGCGGPAVATPQPQTRPDN